MAKAPSQHKRPSIGKRHARKHRTPEQRGTSSNRGYDYRWQQFRASFLAANPLCEFCLHRGRVEPATVADHDLPHGGDPELFWANTFTALCKFDHDSTKARLEAAYSGDRLLRAIRTAKGLS